MAEDLGTVNDNDVERAARTLTSADLELLERYRADKRMQNYTDEERKRIQEIRKEWKTIQEKRMEVNRRNSRR